MGEEDVDGDIEAGVEIDGRVLATVLGDLDDPAIDHRHIATGQIGADIGRMSWPSAKRVSLSVQSWNS